MCPRAELPAELENLPFTRRAALQQGVPRRRLSADDLTHPFHGVRAHRNVGGDIRWLCRAYCERMRAGNCFSHTTAAAIRGLPLPAYATADAAIHVASPPGRRAPEGRGIIGHRLSVDAEPVSDHLHFDHRRGEMFALPVVSPRTMFAQLTAVLAPDDLVAIGDAMVGGEKPLISIADLMQLKDSRRGWKGRGNAVAALEQIRRGSRSRPESLLRLQIIRAGLPEPELNLEVFDDTTGVAIARPDPAWPRYRALVEGDLHRTSRGKFRSDISRFERYSDADWSSMRAHAGDVFGDPNPLIERIARRLRARGWTSSVALRHVHAAIP